MKNIFFLLVALGSFYTSSAQTIADVGKITLSIVAPEEMDGLTSNQVVNLYAKCVQIATSKHVGAVGYATNFALSPKLTVNDTKVADGGMQSITIVSAELTLFVQQADTRMIFATLSKRVSGSGTNQAAAISNAIANISVNDPEFDQFIETAKGKIVSYYESKCDDIMKQAEAMVKKQDYQQAIGILMGIPEEVKGCYDNAQKKSLVIYKAYENKMCAQQLQDAKIQLAANNYEEALAVLKNVDPECKCSKEANMLIKETAAKVTAQQKKEWDTALRIYEDAITMEQHRVDAEKEIALAEYKHKKAKN